LTVGPDGALWAAASGTGSPIHEVARVDTAGNLTTFPTPDNNDLSADAFSIATGSDGNLWYTQSPSPGRIVRITPAGVQTPFTIDAASDAPQGITAGPDGALWFAVPSTANIGRITTSGNVTLFPISPPSGSSAKPSPTAIVTGPDGNLWFTDFGTNTIGRITTVGAAIEFTLPTANAGPDGIAAGPDGNIWFTEQNGNKIGRVQLAAAASTGGVATTTATAFATVINTGSSAATGCAITPTTPVPASFVYQTTNPATNALTGSANTPASIAAGAAQTFVIAFTPNAGFVPNNVTLGFSCAGLAAAPSNTGLNTLLLSATAGPVPDIVALAASVDPGIVDIPGANGTGAFAVATVNVGASGTITATANTGSATLPVALTICQTNPTTGVCLASPGASASATINAGNTPTFAIFVAGSDSVPFNPANSRVFVSFADANGIVRGSTSVAVRTQ
jgi:streptogramin lyase